MRRCFRQVASAETQKHIDEVTTINQPSREKPRGYKVNQCVLPTGNQWPAVGAELPNAQVSQVKCMID